MQKFVFRNGFLLQKKKITLCVDKSCVSCLINCQSVESGSKWGGTGVILEGLAATFQLSKLCLQHCLCNFYKSSQSCQYKVKVHSSEVSVQIFLVIPLGQEDYHIFITSLVHWGFLFVLSSNSPLFFSFLLCKHILISPWLDLFFALFPLC